MEFEQVTLPFIDTFQKAKQAVLHINNNSIEKKIRPIVFSTSVNPEIRRLFKNSSCIFFDFFDTFISRLESELNMQSSHTIGRFHGLLNDTVYNVRIDAMNYAMGTDDGVSTKEYNKAEVILLGVSRTGKTPTCLYLGLQYGIYAANYPPNGRNPDKKAHDPSRCTLAVSPEAFRSNDYPGASAKDPFGKASRIAAIRP